MDSHDQEIPQLARALRRERILRARARSPWEKMQAGGDLFDAACQLTKIGIQRQYPHWSNAQIFNEIRRRLDRKRARDYRVKQQIL